MDQSRLEWACAPLWRARALRRADSGGRAGMSHDGMCAETDLVFNLDVSGCDLVQRRATANHVASNASRRRGGRRAAAARGSETVTFANFPPRGRACDWRCVKEACACVFLFRFCGSSVCAVRRKCGALSLHCHFLTFRLSRRWEMVALMRSGRWPFLRPHYFTRAYEEGGSWGCSCLAPESASGL